MIQHKVYTSNVLKNTQDCLGYLTLFLALFLYPHAMAFAVSGSGAELPDLVENVIPGVVNISSTQISKNIVIRGLPQFFGMFGIPEEQMQKQSTLGSGFIIDTSGYVLTNNHVIENATEVIITLWDKRKFPAKIIGRDKLYDLALLQIKGGATIPNLKPNALGNSEAVRIAESVFAIGNPFGLQHTVTSGIISAKNRSIGIGPYDDFLQTDCSINFGNSGGPLFNLKGEVIGINTAINSQGQGLGFAIPINEVKDNLNSIKNFGFIARVWLGILGEKNNSALQFYYNLSTDTGVIVARLVNSAPAIKSGILPGDILLKINDIEITERSDIQRFLRKKNDKDNVKIKLSRKGKTMTKDVKVTIAPNSNDLPDGVL